MSRLTLISLVFSLLVLTTGCNPYAYINVPPQAGDLALHSPNQKMVREVEIEALRVLLRDRPLSQPTELQCPEGTSESTLKMIVSRLGELAPPPPEVSPETSPDISSAITVTQVRIRGARAQVDMLYPTLAGMPQLLTVYLSYTPINYWRVDRIVDWPGATHTIDHGGATQP